MLSQLPVAIVAGCAPTRMKMFAALLVVATVASAALSPSADIEGGLPDMSRRGIRCLNGTAADPALDADVICGETLTQLLTMMVHPIKVHVSFQTCPFEV